jgi:hypothetical protein
MLRHLESGVCRNSTTQRGFTMIALLRTCNGLEKSQIKPQKTAALAARGCYLNHIVQTECE